MTKDIPILPKEWQDGAKIISKIIAKCWILDNFKAEFIKNPQSVLEKEGLSIPQGVTVRVDINSSKWTSEALSPGSQEIVISIPLPPKPAEVSIEELQNWLNEKGTQPRGLPMSCC